MTKFASLDPRNDQVIAEHEIFSKEAVDGAAKLAKLAFHTWSALSYSKRKRILLKWKQEIARRSDEFAEIVSKETGKPLGDAKLEVSITVSHIGWAANKAGFYLKAQRQIGRAHV